LLVELKIKKSMTASFTCKTKFAHQGSSLMEQDSMQFDRKVTLLGRNMHSVSTGQKEQVSSFLCIADTNSPPRRP
jgi:hypothetical protein